MEDDALSLSFLLTFTDLWMGNTGIDDHLPIYYETHKGKKKEAPSSHKNFWQTSRYFIRYGVGYFSVI